MTLTEELRKASELTTTRDEVPPDELAAEIDTPFDLVDAIEKHNPTSLSDAIAATYVTNETDGERQWSQTILFLEEALAIAKHKHEVAARSKGADISNSALVTLCKVPTIVPKGKALDIVFGETDLVIQGKDFNLSTPYSNIDVVLKLPEYEAVAKLTAHKYQFILRLKTPVTHKKNRLSYLSFVLGCFAEQSDANVVFHVDEAAEDFTDKKLHEIAEMLLQSLTSMTVIKTYPEVSGKRYVSTSGAPYVKCYRRTSPGILFFLPQGLCFVNPPVFLSRQEIDSISWSRETSEALRTFDVTVEMVDGQRYEFSMLEKEEIPSITEFVGFFKTLRDEDDGIAPDDDAVENGEDMEDDEGEHTADDGSDNDQPPAKKKAKTTKNANVTHKNGKGTTTPMAAPPVDDDDDEADSNYEQDDDDGESEEDEWVGSESCSDRAMDSDDSGGSDVNEDSD
ncbi:hypothetical protein H310_10998 [Aphanomyces invadans]|uniref:FACT complex subunit SSRP1 n=1 Tax=Aphanomyces invadans TaxID=157072 RepID=A0A024TPJ6_9STRA|nr:hypothetical protein H310_10998 [Aphanomyces invadans]ETV95556.1 hypothetical protein H310_10998 [Aphanomyces invadans]|eukprot:XP_008875749.1 hypothetical protein H310_10998 [Aphanomyces invadans]